VLGEKTLPYLNTTWEICLFAARITPFPIRKQKLLLSRFAKKLGQIYPASALKKVFTSEQILAFGSKTSGPN
jgi:hypothetical protein